jgi:hypothetical protein
MARFVNSTPLLREFSVAGDDSHYLQTAVCPHALERAPRTLNAAAQAYPLLEALKTNTSLHHIDVSRFISVRASLGPDDSHVRLRNRLGDEGIKILADVRCCTRRGYLPYGLTQALAVNRTLRSFNAERNRIGIKVLGGSL